MKVEKAENDLMTAIASTELGRLELWGKRYFLDAGVTMGGFVDKPDPFPTVHVPKAEGADQDMEVEGTTDPVLVCISRRGFTGRDNTDLPTTIPIPTQTEARTENASGKDIFGGEWKAPRLPYKALDLAITEARRAN